MGRHATLNKEDIERLKIQANAPENPITYLAIDPGKFNGVCGYDSRYYLQFMHIVNAEDIIDFLHAFENVQVCVCEDFKLYPNKATRQYYSDMETPRVIGRIEHWAHLCKAEVVKQAASIKPTGYAWIGKKPPSKASNQNDSMDAHVHFMYWAIKTGRIPAADLFKKDYKNGC